MLAFTDVYDRQHLLPWDSVAAISQIHIALWIVRHVDGTNYLVSEDEAQLVVKAYLEIQAEHEGTACDDDEPPWYAGEMN